VPLTAVREPYFSCGFWATARKMVRAGLVVTGNVRPSEMDEEALRWRRLGAEAERLEQQIVERWSVAPRACNRRSAAAWTSESWWTPEYYP
jgi:hypothetical protein